ncbi:hypothetical protein N9Y89_01795 [bacterium]|nr:hypothetical protein [bacterium]
MYKRVIEYSLESENMNHHTHYLKFKDSHAYVEEFWSGTSKGKGFQNNKKGT